MSSYNHKRDFETMLADSGMPITEQQAKAHWEQKLDDAGSVVTNASSVSPFWRLISAIITQPLLWLVHSIVTTWLPNSFVKTAKGPALDILAWAMRIERQEAQAAKGQVKFARANASAVQIIPAGTVVETSPIGGVVYRVKTTEEATLNVGQTSLYVNVAADGVGAAYNLPGGYYAILPTPLGGGVTAVNTGAWLMSPGTDKEADDDLRERVRNRFAAVNQWHVDATYIAMVSEFAGVQVRNIFIEKDAPRGPGTANIYILFDTGEPSPGFLNSIQNYIMLNGNHGHGDDIRLMAMPSESLTLTVDVWPQPTLSMAEKTQLKADIEQMIRAAFRENTNYEVTTTQPNSRFSMSRLGQELHDQFPGILDMDFGTDRLVNGWFVYRLFGLTVRFND